MTRILCHLRSPFYRDVIGEEILEGEMHSSDEECESLGDERGTSKDITSP